MAPFARDHAPAGKSFAALWDSLLPIGRDGSTGGYRRFAWTQTDRELRQWFREAAAARSMTTEVDRNGNLWAWWGEPRPHSVVTGSHLDSVPDGGPLDGPLGIVSGFAAVDLLRTGYPAAPKRSIAVVCFAEEEGARFGLPCVGSRLLTGALAPEDARRLADQDGVTLADAMREAGHDPGALGRDKDVLARIGAFVELHVEQGRTLADLDAPVGVASEIWPHGRWRLDFAGRADHAGTTRLADREDPMLPFARTVIAARDAATTLGAVATIGKVIVQPNGTNAIPSRVSAWLDARAPAEATVGELVDAVAPDAHRESWSPRVDFDPDLRDRIATLLGGAPILGTGAGHDAGVLAGQVPTAMLFVRNLTGVSHSPHEHATREDCLAGVEALATVLEDLACR